MKTALHALHLELGARMVDFAGWDMPIQYKSILKEHEAVRERCGIFDCSHMGQVFVSGSQAQAFVDHLITNNLNKISVGKAQYSPMLNEKGTFVDDLIVYWLSEEAFMIVVNASNIEKDVAWMKSVIESKGFDVQLEDRSNDFSLLAVQGPEAPAVLDKVFSGAYAELGNFAFKSITWKGIDLFCCRTGYTGEAGVELILPNGVAIEAMRALIDAGAEPCGLGARDTLRLEKGYSLYGNDIDESNDPLSTGLQWTVDLSKADFVGKAALLQMKEAGFAKKLVGYKVDGRALARHGALVFNAQGEEIGVVTSGAFSPSLKQGIGLAYIDAGHDETELFLEVRQKQIPAKVHARQFIA